MKIEDIISGLNIANLTAYITEFGSLVAVLAVIVSFISLFAQSVFGSKRIKTTQGEVQEALEKLLSGDQTVDLSQIDFEDHTRLDELRALQSRYQRQVSRNQLAFNLLIFSQYIVGAVLATAFAQQNVSGNTGSILGLLVLISTAIQQRFRPDLLATQAKNRLTKCGRTIREIEDGVFKIKSRSPDQPSIVSLRDAATQGIDLLEALELSGMETFNTQRLEVAQHSNSTTAKSGVSLGDSVKSSKSPSHLASPGSGDVAGVQSSEDATPKS